MVMAASFAEPPLPSFTVTVFPDACRPPNKSAGSSTPSVTAALALVSPPALAPNAARASKEAGTQIRKILVSGSARSDAFRGQEALTCENLQRKDTGVYLKLQSALVHALPLFREAFPLTPWVFAYRRGVEVLASLLKGAAHYPAPDAGESEHVDPREIGVKTAPCMRLRLGGQTTAFVRTVTGAFDDEEAVLALPAEDYCAASVANLAAIALQEAATARRDALEEAIPAVGKGFSANDGAVTAAALSSELVDLSSAPGQLLSPQFGNGVLGDAAQGLMVSYEAMPGAVVQALRFHMRPLCHSKMRASADGDALYNLREGASRDPGVRSGGRATYAPHEDPLGGAEGEAALLAVARKYSKARGRVGHADGNAPPPLADPSMNAAGDFVGDSEAKQEYAWPSLRRAARKFLDPLTGYMEAFNANTTAVVSQGSLPVETEESELKNGWLFDQEAASLPSLSQGSVMSRAGRSLPASVFQTGVNRPKGLGSSVPLPAWDAQMLPIGGGYPQTYPMADILEDWNADIVTIPSHYGRYSSLRVFDYEHDQNELEEYRKAEVPFIIKNLPGMQRTLDEWAKDEYLVSLMGKDTKYAAEKNDNNHFMYYNKGRGGRSNFNPPTEETRITLPDWLTLAKSISSATEAEEAATLPPGWAIPSEALQTSLNPVSNALPTRNRDLRLPGSRYRRVVAEAAVAATDAHEKQLGADRHPLPPVRAKRTMVYMRASSDPRIGDASENAFINRSVTIAGAFFCFRSFAMIVFNLLACSCFRI
jgi:hypothetical protein